MATVVKTDAERIQVLEEQMRDLANLVAHLAGSIAENPSDAFDTDCVAEWYLDDSDPGEEPVSYWIAKRPPLEGEDG